MGETVPVRCPGCGRGHRYVAPAYPCVCGAPVSPPIDRRAEACVVTHRTWDDEWVTVRCGACGREDQWPHPELSCHCGSVVRVPVTAPSRPRTDGSRPAPGSDAAAAPSHPTGSAGPNDPVDAAGPADAVDPAAASSASPPFPVFPPPADGFPPFAFDGLPWHPAADRPGEPGPEPGEPSKPDVTAPSAGPAPQGPHTHATPGAPGAPFGPGPGAGLIPGTVFDPGAVGPGSPPRSRGERAPVSDSGRPAFRPVPIRSARDAVTAAALYLRRLGHRDVRRADQRPPSGIGLAARGVRAHVDPTVRPATVRDVECLWLTAMTESAACVYFSLAGYAADARARADSLGVPLFLLDLTGTPRPVNGPARDMAAADGRTGDRPPA